MGNPCAAELFVSIFNSFEAEISDAISASNDEKMFILMTK